MITNFNPNKLAIELGSVAIATATAAAAGLFGPLPAPWGTVCVGVAYVGGRLLGELYPGSVPTVDITKQDIEDLLKVHTDALTNQYGSLATDLAALQADVQSIVGQAKNVPDNVQPAAPAA